MLYYRKLGIVQFTEFEYTLISIIFGLAIGILLKSLVIKINPELAEKLTIAAKQKKILNEDKSNSKNPAETNKTSPLHCLNSRGGNQEPGDINFVDIDIAENFVFKVLEVLKNSNFVRKIKKIPPHSSKTQKVRELYKMAYFIIKELGQITRLNKPALIVNKQLRRPIYDCLNLYIERKIRFLIDPALTYRIRELLQDSLALKKIVGITPTLFARLVELDSTYIGFAWRQFKGNLVIHIVQLLQERMGITIGTVIAVFFVHGGNLIAARSALGGGSLILLAFQILISTEMCGDYFVPMRPKPALVINSKSESVFQNVYKIEENQFLFNNRKINQQAPMVTISSVDEKTITMSKEKSSNQLTKPNSELSSEEVEFESHKIDVINLEWYFNNVKKLDKKTCDALGNVISNIESVQFQNSELSIMQKLSDECIKLRQATKSSEQKESKEIIVREMVDHASTQKTNVLKQRKFNKKVHTLKDLSPENQKESNFEEIKNFPDQEKILNE